MKRLIMFALAVASAAAWGWGGVLNYDADEIPAEKRRIWYGDHYVYFGGLQHCAGGYCSSATPADKSYLQYFVHTDGYEDNWAFNGYHPSAWCLFEFAPGSDDEQNANPCDVIVCLDAHPLFRVYTETNNFGRSVCKAQWVITPTVQPLQIGVSIPPEATLARWHYVTNDTERTGWLRLNETLTGETVLRQTWRALPDGVTRACYTIGTADGEITSACLFDEQDAARWAANAYETWDDTYYLTSTNFTAEAARQFVREYRQIGPRMRAGTVVRIR